MTEILAEPKPYVDPLPVLEVRTFVRGTNSLTALVNPETGEMLFRIYSHGFKMMGQKIEVKLDIQLVSHSVADAFDTCSEHDKKIEAEASRQAMKAQNAQFEDQMRKAGRNGR